MSQHVGRDAAPGQALYAIDGIRQIVRRLLRVPLVAKLAGANLVIVLTAWVAAYAVHVNPGELRMLAVMTVAMLVGLAVNLVLVSIALRPIRDLEETATRVWAGDLDTRVPRSSIADSDLEQVGGTLNFLLTALAEDRRRVRVLASEIVRTGDRERSRLGKELHDSIAQSLAAVRYQLIAIEREITDPSVGAQIRAVRESAGEVLEQVRLLSHTVHPQILDDLGLVPALRHLARKVNGDIAVTVIVPDDAEVDLRSIPTDVASALYRVAQESIANAIRHAAPRKIEVRVGRVGNGVAMQIEDDGAGFDTEKTEAEGQAMGLFTMRERVSLLRGTFMIVSTPRQGTSVRVQVPLDATTSRATSAMIPKERLHAG
jgi:signal transduction histidine kinase